MKAGRDLDALVAEKVMGWTEIRFGEELTAGSVSGFGIEPGVGFRRAFPAYSADIAAAWEVVEKFNSTNIQKYPSGEYLCGLADTKFYEAIAETAPLAICLAALKAVGYKE